MKGVPAILFGCLSPSLWSSFGLAGGGWGERGDKLGADMPGRVVLQKLLSVWPGGGPSDPGPESVNPRPLLAQCLEVPNAGGVRTDPLVDFSVVET